MPGLRARGVDHGQAVEAASMEAAITGQKAVGPDLRVRADEEVGNQLLPLSALAPVGGPEVAGEIGAGLVERVEPDPCCSEMLVDPVRLAEP